MKFCIWLKQPDGIISPRYLGRARYNPCNDMTLYMLMPFNYLVSIFDRTMRRLKLGKFAHCPHCHKMI